MNKELEANTNLSLVTHRQKSRRGRDWRSFSMKNQALRSRLGGAGNTN